MVIPEGFAQVTFRFTGTAVPNGAVVTFGVSVDGAFADDPAEVASLALGTWSAQDMMGGLCSTLHLVETLVKFGPNATGPDATNGTELDGTLEAQAVPPNTALLLRKRTGSGGRQGRGRMYLPGAPEAELNASGNWSGGFYASYVNRCDDWFAALADAEIPMVLLHSEHSPAAPPRIVTSLGPEITAATQRLRLRR